MYAAMLPFLDTEEDFAADVGLPTSSKANNAMSSKKARKSFASGALFSPTAELKTFNLPAGKKIFFQTVLIS